MFVMLMTLEAIMMFCKKILYQLLLGIYHLVLFYCHFIMYFYAADVYSMIHHASLITSLVSLKELTFQIRYAILTL